MDAFQQRLFNSQRETYFLLNLFLFDTFLFDNAPKWMPLWKMFSMWSQFF